MKTVISLAIVILFLTLSGTSFAASNICYKQQMDSIGQVSQVEVYRCDPSQVCDPLPSPHCVAPNSLQAIFGVIKPPTAVINLGPGSIGIKNVLNNTLTLIYVAAGIIFVFMVVISGLQWILSGGEKEKIAGARQRLTYAIIGITLLALSFVIITLIGQITGFSFFKGQSSPSSESSPGVRTQQHLAPSEKCAEGTQSLGTCDALKGYFCVKVDEGGGISRCMPRPTSTPTPTPDPNTI